MLIKFKKGNANNLIYNVCYGKSYKLIDLFNIITKIIKKQKINIELNLIGWPKNTMLIEKRSFKASIKNKV